MLNWCIQSPKTVLIWLWITQNVLIVTHLNPYTVQILTNRALNMATMLSHPNRQTTYLSLLWPHQIKLRIRINFRMYAWVLQNKTKKNLLIKSNDLTAALSLDRLDRFILFTALYTELGWSCETCNMFCDVRPCLAAALSEDTQTPNKELFLATWFIHVHKKKKKESSIISI